MKYREIMERIPSKLLPTIYQWYYEKLKHCQGENTIHSHYEEKHMTEFLVQSTRQRRKTKGCTQAIF